MNITVIEELNVHQWDESLSKFSANPFITSAWLESFRTSQRVPIYFRFVSEGQTIGAIAGLILEPSHAILRKIDRSLFFFSGPAMLRHENALIKNCMLSLTHFAQKKGYTALDIRSWDYPYDYDLGVLPFYKHLREEFIIDLRGELSAIHKRMKKSIREQARRATREGITFHESRSPESIALLIRLLEETKAIRQSKNYEDYSYYYISYLDEQRLYKLFQQQIVRVFFAQRQETPLSMLLNIVHQKRAYALLIGNNAEAYALRAPAFLWFHTINTFKEEGIESLNLGGVPNDSGASGLYFFKMSLGGEKHQCSGGTTSYLQGSLCNLLYQIYTKQIFAEMKKNVSGLRRKYA